jgi:hypothetical protein
VNSGNLLKLLHVIFIFIYWFCNTRQVAVILGYNFTQKKTGCWFWSELKLQFYCMLTLTLAT